MDDHSVVDCMVEVGISYTASGFTSIGSAKVFPWMNCAAIVLRIFVSVLYHSTAVSSF